MTVRLTVDGRTREGSALDLDGDLSPESVVEAVRNGAADGVRVDCPDPGPVHDHVGHVGTDPTLDLRGALAAAARSRGHVAPQRSAIEAVRDRLAACSPPPTDVASARRAVAEAGADEQRLRERVATLRGRVQALRDAGSETAASQVESDLEEAVERLTEVETERIAAEQRLRAEEREAREARDERERRLALQDRLANHRRAARADLAATVYDRFRTAAAALPGEGDPGGGPGEYEGDPVTAALAVARVADLDAPVVLSAGRFRDAETAARRLEAPVIRL